MELCFIFHSGCKALDFRCLRGPSYASDSRGVIQANFHSAKPHDLRAQIQKFWNIRGNLNFEENSFYSFPSFAPSKLELNWRFH